MNITVKIEAPELAKAIEALAAALSGNQAAPKNVLEKAMEKTVDKKQSTGNKQEVKKDKQEEVALDPQPEVEEKGSPEISLETVRGKLAALSQSGKQAQVKELITQFGAKKLTEVPAEKYADLLAAAEEIA